MQASYVRPPGLPVEGLVSNGVNYPSWADCDIRAIMKEFRVVLAPLPDNGYLAANSDVTGHVLLVTDEAKSGYKAIEVTLKGYATVVEQTSLCHYNGIIIIPLSFLILYVEGM